MKSWTQKAHYPYKLNISREKASFLGRFLFKRLKNWCDNNSVFLYVSTTGWFDLSDAETSKEPAKAFLYVAHDFLRKLMFHSLIFHLLFMEK